MRRTKRVNAGGWRTLEWFFGGTGTAFFDAPAGARIKMRYGLGWFGFDAQKQTLDGRTIKRLSIGRSSFARARMQMSVSQSADVTYDVYPGETLSEPRPDF